VAVVALSLLVTAVVVVNRLDAYFRELEQTALGARATEVGRIVAIVAIPASGRTGTVIGAGNTLNPDVAEAIGSPDFLRFLADEVAQADVRVDLGGAVQVADGRIVVAAAEGGTFTAPLTAEAERGQAREPFVATDVTGPISGGTFEIGRAHV